MKIRYTIEPSWAHIPHSGEIGIEDEALDGMTGAERERAIGEVVSDAVNDDCLRGWEEVP
jgi:hypothetical protein